MDAEIAQSTTLDAGTQTGGEGDGQCGAEGR